MVNSNKELEINIDFLKMDEVVLYVNELLIKYYILNCLKIINI